MHDLRFIRRKPHDMMLDVGMSGCRLFRFFLFTSCLGTSLVAVAACTNTADQSGDGTGTDTGGEPSPYAGASTCAACHAEQYDYWLVTGHADALDTLRTVSQEANPACVGCHVVGFGEAGGYVDENATPDLAGVQCENCHGAAAEHAAAPGDLDKRPTIELSAELCGGCHSDVHHPTYEEWQLSKHAAALSTLTALPSAQDECLACHSEDYRWAERHNRPLPDVATAESSLECATCHSAHTAFEAPAQLRKPVAELCGECHTAQESKLGDSPHHPQVEMVRGEGAFNDGGDPLVKLGPHSGLVYAEGGEACAQCHVIRHSVDDPSEGRPNVTGHTFNPFDEGIDEHQPEDRYSGCRLCHTVTDAQTLKDTVQAEIEGRLEALAPTFDENDPAYIDPAGLSAADQDRLATAKFDYQFVNADGSRGVHNIEYARAALDQAEAIVASFMP
jgi:predicted CXXCH cytochrome family protein